MLDTNVEFTRPLRVIISSRGSRGNPGLVWVDGPWEPGIDFVGTEAIYHRGSSYRALQSHTSSADNQPGSGVNWEQNWTIIALGSGAFNGPYENDAEAASYGVAIGDLYRKNDGSVAWRQL